MLFILCLIFTLSSYASEMISFASEMEPLLPDKNMVVSTKQLKRFYTYNSSLLPYTVCNKIYFYDPITKEACSFESVNDAIANLFQKNGLSIFDIVSSEEMKTFLQNNNRDEKLFDRFIYFFKQISDWYDYACIPKELWHEKWVYNLHHFLYAIISPENALKQNDIYNHFFTCFQKEAENCYDYRKCDLITIGGLGSVGLLSIFVWFTAFQTDFTMSIKANSDIGAKFCAAGAGIMPTLFLSTTIPCYLLNYFGYQQFLKNIKNQNQELLIV